MSDTEGTPDVPAPAPDRPPQYPFTPPVEGTGEHPLPAGDDTPPEDGDDDSEEGEEEEDEETPEAPAPSP
jgi:hypothetical protein